MGGYGAVAVKAVKLLTSGNIDRPRDAWKMAAATSETLKSISSQDKGCPRAAFLGLCQEGVVRGIPPGRYTNSKENKEYAIEAVRILQQEPALCSNLEALWKKVMKRKDKNINSNGQMEVVVSLWNDSLIAI